MTLKERIVNDLKAALRSKDEVAKRTLRMLKSELANKEIELSRELDEPDEMAVLAAAVKSRRDSIAEYEKAGREDLAAAEQAEIEVVQRYLPEPLSEPDARAAIEELARELGLSDKKQMGQLIKAVMERYRGRIEGKTASRIAASVLQS